MTQTSRTPAPTPAKRPSLRAQLIGVVDRVPETRGCGVIYRKGNQMIRLRPQPPGGATVVFELHERDISAAWLQQTGNPHGPLMKNPRFTASAERASGWPLLGAQGNAAASGWSVRGTGIPAAPPRTLTPRPGASVPHRSGGTSVADEWKSLGFNCGGALLAWIGVAGAGAATPVTGGISATGAVLLYGGAIAASGQCVASVYRVHNATHGRASVNQALDTNQYYHWTMLGADWVGLFGAGAALKEAWVADRALRVAGTSWSAALQRTTTAAQRASVAANVELQATRIGSRVLSRLARQKLLDGAAAVLGIYASYDGGVIHELIIWKTEERR